MNGGRLAPHVRFPDISDSAHFQRRALDSATDGIFVQSSEGRYLYCNPAFARMLEHSVEEIVGRIDPELIEPDCKRESPAREQSNSYGPDGERSYEIRRGSRRFEVRKIPYAAGVGSAHGEIGYLKDVTEIRRAEALRFLQRDILERIAGNEELEAILDELVSFIEREVAGAIGSVLLLDPSGKQLHVASAKRLPESYNLAIEGIRIGPSVGSCGTAAYRGERVLVDDIATDPLWADFLELAMAHGLRACWSTPIISRKDPARHVLGTFAIYSRQAGLLDTRLGGTIDQVEYLACLAIEHHQSKAALRSSERKLQASEETSHQILESLPMGVFIHDGHRIFYANPKARDLVGVANGEDLSTLAPFDVVHPEFREMARERVARIIQTGEALPPVEAAIMRVDGSTLEVEVQSIPTRFEERPCVLVSFYDITARKQFARDLLEQKEYLQAIFQATPECIKVVDQDGSVLEMNESGCAMIQATSNDEVSGRSVFEVISPRDLARFKAFHQGICRGERGVLEFEIVGLGGKRRLMESHAVPLDLRGRKVHLAVSRDITNRKHLEEQVRQVQKMEAVGKLAGGIAHDFNNILTVINGYCDLLQMSLVPDNPALPPLREIRDAGERAKRLTEQLLAFSRRAIVERKNINLNDMLEESLSILRRLIGENVTLTFVPSQFLATIVADPAQLEQVVLNLAVNARDAMPRGGRLTLKTKNVLIEDGSSDSPELPPGPYVELSVTDTGVGMDPKLTERIFEPFFTTKEVGKGTGLGLSVVHGVVQQFGGAIAVETALGLGTTFRILFPAGDESGEILEIDDERLDARGTETILLVEDEEPVRRIARLALEAQGYIVFDAEGGAEALRIAEDYPRPIHLLVTDVVMPGLEGGDLSEAIRTVRPDIEVLFMSGYTDDAVLRQGIEASGDHFLQKPFTPLGLARTVRLVLDCRGRNAV